MRKLLIIISLIAISIASYAQECSTAWPYLYPEFVDGVAYLKNGRSAQYSVNIHTLKARVHYIENGIVKEANAYDIAILKIGSDEYVSNGQDILKVEASGDKGLVASLNLGEFDKLSDSGGAYGSSTTNSATMRLSSVEVAGQVNQNHIELRQNKENGQRVGIRKTYYLVSPEKAYLATRKSLEAEFGKDFKTWSKDHKIKWNKPESLITIFDFIYE